MARHAGPRDRRHHFDRARHTGRADPPTKQRGNHCGTGYPQLRLVACGTRTLIDAVFGPSTTGETTYAAA
ncbi:hypothetical protein GCM10010185_47800 [Saccharothrix coeruleofusca]|uniref:Uncharacterized protein n=1 Tax=Saccharothrix coeruleofusca TaxID=33919 RepID=A0A918EG60_9PSEU|nr:hypothetical protein GCM10010185_47800 [Saccharothrix coeruleofusca]